MQISTNELRQIALRLLEHLDAGGKATLNIDEDYYWSIPRGQRHDPYKEPTEFTLGQLSDDWTELKNIIQGQSAPVGYGLVWLSAILCAIGEDNVP